LIAIELKTASRRFKTKRKGLSRWD